jgi:AcrR family transcriptional regulator
MKIPKTKKGLKTKMKLLAAAEKVFGEKGYSDSSVSQITRKARVAMGTFYIYYDSKSEIFVDLVKKLNHDLRKAISISVTGLSTRKEIEITGFKSFFEFLKKHKSLYRIVRQAEFVDPELFQWYYNEISKGYAEGLSVAMDRGEVRRMDPELLSFELMGVADFIGMKYILWDDKLNDEMIDQVMDFILHGLLVHAENSKSLPHNGDEISHRIGNQNISSQ